ncbi:hypothetical protein K438DRAFT_80258 [Mycena galopus ATCC 62051]|nr:hypothetical protein K438DRAFT_80258 [Mycena galopus ATCC 62051]
MKCGIWCGRGCVIFIISLSSNLVHLCRDRLVDPLPYRRVSVHCHIDGLGISFRRAVVGLVPRSCFTGEW